MDKKKPANPEAEYILKKMRERNPHDTVYGLSLRARITRSTLYNILYRSKNPFQVCNYLRRICADLGISMESVLIQSDTPYDRDKELNYWKDKYFAAERSREEMYQRIEELRKSFEELPNK